VASSSNSTSTLSNVEPGVLGFLVVAAIGVALVFLLRSMNKQFHKIGPKPEDDLLDLAELAKSADDEPEEPTPENVVPGEVLPDDARERLARTTGTASRPAGSKRTPG
jgi:hypothetical protein